MPSNDHKPAAFTAKDARKLIDAGRRVQNTPAPLPARRERRLPGVQILFAELEDDLTKTTEVEATVWAKFPDQTPKWQSTERKITVDGIMLDEDLTLEAGSFVCVVITAAACVVLNSRECPIED